MLPGLRCPLEPLKLTIMGFEDRIIKKIAGGAG
jgi:hypothetical protein